MPGKVPLFPEFAASSLHRMSDAPQRTDESLSPREAGVLSLNLRFE
jgi:hypothetical protein